MALKKEDKRGILKKVLGGIAKYGSKFFKPEKLAPDLAEKLRKGAAQRMREGGGWPKSRVPDNIW